MRYKTTPRGNQDVGAGFRRCSSKTKSSSVEFQQSEWRWCAAVGELVVVVHGRSTACLLCPQCLHLFLSVQGGIPSPSRHWRQYSQFLLYSKDHCTLHQVVLVRAFLLSVHLNSSLRHLLLLLVQQWRSGGIDVHQSFFYPFCFFPLCVCVFCATNFFLSFILVVLLVYFFCVVPILCFCF